MKKLFGILAICVFLSSCSLIHKMDIQQGNVVTTEMVNRLHTGMSEAKVKEIMGTPILINTFSDDRIDYIYTFKPGSGTMTEKQITLVFRHHVLQNISGNV